MARAHGTRSCAPREPRQVDGDYRKIFAAAAEGVQRAEAERQAGAITAALGGCRLFEVGPFVAGDRVRFSEVSPRPQDTGLVRLASQDLSEFALHARAILGVPVPPLCESGPSASATILGNGDSDGLPALRCAGLEPALAAPQTDLYRFGKPTISGTRRLGVALASGENVDEAHNRARSYADSLRIEYCLRTIFSRKSLFIFGKAFPVLYFRLGRPPQGALYGVFAHGPTHYRLRRRTVMHKKLTTLLLAMMLGLGTLTLAACDSDGPAEEAGENIDEAADNAGDSMENAADNTEEGMENTGDNMQDSMEETGDEMEEETNENN